MYTDVFVMFIISTCNNVCVPSRLISTDTKHIGTTHNRHTYNSVSKLLGNRVTIEDWSASKAVNEELECMSMVNPLFPLSLPLPPALPPPVYIYINTIQRYKDTKYLLSNTMSTCIGPTWPHINIFSIWYIDYRYVCVCVCMQRGDSSIN